MNLIEIIEKHTETALKQAEELRAISETMSGLQVMATLNDVENERTREMLADSSSILSQVLQSIEDM